jgi:hypothetical protein
VIGSGASPAEANAIIPDDFPREAKERKIGRVAELLRAGKAKEPEPETETSLMDRLFGKSKPSVWR